MMIENQTIEINNPKVIFLDLKMPRIGTEVLERIKKGEQMKSIPVVILTSSKQHPEINTCYDQGANGYVVNVGLDNFSKAAAEQEFNWLLLKEQPKYNI